MFVSLTNEPQGDFNFKYENGQFVGLGTQVNNISAELGFNEASLAAIVAELDGVDIWIKGTTTPIGYKVDLINIFQEHYTALGYITETVSFLFRNIDVNPQTREVEVNSLVDSETLEVLEIVGIVAFVLLVILLICAFAPGVIAAALAAIGEVVGVFGAFIARFIWNLVSLY